MATTNSKIIKPTRRELLMAGGAGLGALAAGPDFARAAECVLTSTQVEGPYYIREADDRRDLRSGKPGVDLILRFKVLDTANCEPIGGVVSEIWSCDAHGIYSGHPEVDPDTGLGPGFRGGGRRGRGSGEGGGGRGRPGGPPRGSGGRGGGPPHREPTGPLRFLRGSQTTNPQGEAEFLTVYPGWYTPRAIHVHLKVHLGGNELLTTQLFFPDELTDTIHQTDAYRERYPTPIPNSKDRGVAAGSQPTGAYPTMTTEGKTQVGALTIGVKRS